MTTAAVRPTFPFARCPLCPAPIRDGEDAVSVEIDGQSRRAHRTCPGTDAVLPFAFDEIPPAWAPDDMPVPEPEDDPYLAVYGDPYADSILADEPGHDETTRDIPAALLDGLNPEQADAVSTLSGPLLVVAGPGSGKTTVLTRRIAALLATGTRAHQILAVTFTNKAAAEMRERIARLVGEDVVGPMWVSTFHSACLRILRYHHAEAGLPRSFSIADAKDAARLVGQVAADLDHTTGLNPQETKQFIKDTHAAISRAKNANVSPAELGRSPYEDVRVTAQIMAAYNDRLQQLGAVDFDDILLRALTLLERHPEVTEKYSRRFAHILVDEYQDTNAVQYRIVKLLAAHGNLCVVGDFDQSIYAFRGADPSVMASFARTYPDAKVVALGQNYRSTVNIVDVAQAVVAPNPSVHRAQLRTDNETGEPVRLHEAESNYDEARHVVALIQDRGGDPADHAILVRTNALTRALEQELTDAHLPYQVVGALRFYDRAEIKDALAYLRLAVNPADTLAFERCVNTPKRGIGAASVAAAVNQALADGTTPVDVLAGVAGTGGRAAVAAEKFLAAYGAVVAAVQHGPAEALDAVADAAGLRAELAKATAKEGLDREANLDELISYAQQFITGGSATDPQARDIGALPGWAQTEAFLENVALVSAAETATGEDLVDTGAVSVMTMHAAKGKEFPHVYVVGLEDNICPHSRALGSGKPEDLEEERRLLFVAVSRAMLTLDLSYCRTRNAFGRLSMNSPSMFLADLPGAVEKTVAPPPRPTGGYGRHRSGSYGGGYGQARSGGYSSGGYAPRPAPPASRPVTAHPATVPTSTAGPRVPAGQLQPGVRVRHAMFGDGTVTEADQRTVTVEFEIGTKVLAAGLAPLTLAD